MILVRPRPRRIQQERFALPVAGVKGRRVDSMVNDADSRRVKPELLDCAIANERARHDHTIDLTSRTVIREPAKETYMGRNKIRKVEMQDVVERKYARGSRRGERNRQWIVDDVCCTERPMSRSSAGDRDRPGPRSRRAADDRLQTARSIDRVRWERDDVVAASVLRQSRRKSPCIRLRSSHAPRSEREQGDADHGGDSARYRWPMPLDIAVLGQDPRFGGGGLAQTNAFLAAAEQLGRRPSLLYEPHPRLGGQRLTWRRIEALRQLRAARRLAPAARESHSLWVVATLAQHGGAAPRSGRHYSCWIGTTIDSEWAGRAPGLPAFRRLAAGASIASLRALERKVLRGATELYATSAASRSAVAAASGLEETAVQVLRIPVDSTRFVPEPDEAWRRTLDNPVAAFVGRGDDPRKNVDLLLDAAATLAQVRFRLIGRAPSRPLPANVDAIGEVSDVAEALRGATIFVLPSRQEGFGIVAAEALAAGLPVVTTPSGGPEELIRASGGGSIADGFDPDELAMIIHELLSQPDALAQMRRSGRAYVEREHAPDVFRDRLAAALDALHG